MIRPLWLALLTVGCLSICSTQVWSQTERKSGGNDRLMQQYQQISSERAALQGENARLQQDLAKATAELAAVKKDQEALKSRAGGAQTAVARNAAAAETAARELEQSKKKMDELVARFRETAVSLRDVETERNQLQADLSERNRQFDSCVKDNVGLADLSNEVLDRFEHEGVFSGLARAEPFTRLKRTQIENLVDDYRVRAKELHQPSAAGTGPQPVVSQQ